MHIPICCICVTIHTNYIVRNPHEIHNLLYMYNICCPYVQYMYTYMLHTYVTYMLLLSG